MSAVLIPERRRVSELDYDGCDYVLTDFLGAYDEASESPQAFLVELRTAQGTIPPHFHGADQYQIVVGGSGLIGKAPLPSGAIHYTDGYTPYGPIHAADDGLAFFTLRLEGVFDAYFMPEARDELPGPAGHSFETVADLVPPEASGSRLLAETPNGAGAYELRAAAGEPLPAPDASGLAQPGYYVVLAGHVELDGRRVAGPGLVFHEAGDPHPAARAGDAGAVVAYVNFPSSHQRPTREQRRQHRG